MNLHSGNVFLLTSQGSQRPCLLLWLSCKQHWHIRPQRQKTRLYVKHDCFFTNPLNPWEVAENEKSSRMCMLSHFSGVWLCNTKACSPSGSSVHGVIQARTVEWIAMPSSRRSPWPRDWTCISCIGRWILCRWDTREALRIKLTPAI